MNGQRAYYSDKYEKLVRISHLTVGGGSIVTGKGNDLGQAYVHFLQWARVYLVLPLSPTPP